MSDRPTVFQAPSGTRDWIAPESDHFQWVVATFATFAHRYGFSLIISPMFEDAGVFNRGIGEQSEIARKEMYYFEDRGGRQLALRPEGTASVVRAFIQHHPTLPWKTWYVTPAFRYERPQKGRYRQHHQLGVEVLGTEDPTLDVEVISLAWRFYAGLGLTHVELLLNSMGDKVCRPAYLELLSQHLETHESELCDEHQAAWRANPLRVLDCKRESCVEATQNGPMLVDHLCDPCSDHFSSLTTGLDLVGVPWSLNKRLVRGFDYYTRTTFEFTSHAIQAAQNAIGGGGRYDGLVEELGGDALSGIGFGSGIERLLLALEAEGGTSLPSRRVDVFIVDTTGGAQSLAVAEDLRANGISVDRAYDARSMKSQMKQADRSGARVALLIGPKELESDTVTIRDLRSGDEQRQRTLARVELLSGLNELLSEVK